MNPATWFLVGVIILAGSASTANAVRDWLLNVVREWRGRGH